MKRPKAKIYFRSGFIVVSILAVGGLFFSFSGFRSWPTLSQTLPPPSVPPQSSEPAKVPFIVTHLATPEPVKAIYLTNWVAGTLARRDELIKLIDETELNAVVIDVKDYTGRLAWLPVDPELLATGVGEKRIADIEGLINQLHNKGVYVIGRISVFQDLFLAEKHPELAVKRASDGAIWRDRKGVAWLEAGNPKVWAYTARIARESYARGFDELNFDYIRFPSDGDLTDITYGYLVPPETRADVLARFFKYLAEELGGIPAPRSIDLFGLVTVNHDDLGIGQVLERAEPYFDYICPMVYPSHYAAGFIGYPNPAEHPYEVTEYSLKSARQRLNFLSLLIPDSSTASSTVPVVVPTTITKYSAKLRPWLQDFDLGADYTAPMVQAEKRATYDIGLTSWMLWNPSNRYTRGALESY